MSVDSLKNRIMKRVDLQKFKTDYTDIGSFIKKRRKELNITQDEITTGICSISYLSKIENNQIVPNDFYVREIMEKLDIDEEVYERSIKDREYIDRLIKAFFELDDEEMIKTYTEIKDIEHNVVINLCKLGYTVYFRLDDDNQYVMMLENLVNNMNDFDLKIYLFFAALFFTQNERYRTALELVVLNEKLSGNNDMVDAMFSEISYTIKQRLLIKNCSTEDYYNAMNTYQKYHNVKRVINLALQKSLHLSKENPQKALNNLQKIGVQHIPKEIEGFYYYIKAEIFYQLEKYNEATLMLKHIDENSKFYLRKMTLLLNICLIFNDVEMTRSIKEMIRDYHPDRSEMKTKVYYHYLTQENEEDLKEYLRNVAIPFSIKVEDYDSLKKYTDKVMNICIENSRYKEAMQYYKKYQKEMNKIKTILY